MTRARLARIVNQLIDTSREMQAQDYSQSLYAVSESGDVFYLRNMCIGFIEGPWHGIISEHHGVFVLNRDDMTEWRVAPSGKLFVREEAIQIYDI